MTARMPRNISLERAKTNADPGTKISAWSRRIPICILAAIAGLIATYMSLYQWRLIDSVWDPLFGEQSQRVLDSGPAQQMYAWFGIHDAALGALAYFADVILGLAGSTRRWQYRPWLVLLFGFAVIPLGVVSAILVALQGTVVGYWCFLCLVTAAISLTMVILAYSEVSTTVIYLYRVWSRTHDWSILFKTLIGSAEEAADEVAKEILIRNAA